ncbi:uncharacterized protein I206_101714 [Kwoniella pini CBS 10737]|uniref:FAD dependent oxidoreductase superfamily protein n=1 Tax=Kwoniella pini CBS 10737 TaxID=1296096 RepID=A0A1B9HVX9_9TREE|nr:FAD dependent oxidoreductase superfamily protein [Kwoniella pini CBS 10737]OCF47419.1 FAD dependent oxidoreductase superfamily protein [Kwoniella pini CBS 10737]
MSSSKDSDRLLPVKNRLEPFWLCERDPVLQNARTTTELPRAVDVVIVGSGLTGAMTAYHLYAEAEKIGRRINVVMLEADEVCSGATARNGGHCKPIPFVGYRTEASKHGQTIANQLLTFEASALKQYADLVAKEDINCDMHVTRAFDIFFREDDAASGKKDYEARKSAFPNDVNGQDIRVVNDPKELERLTGIKGGCFGANYPAGHLWPYKLATSLIHIAIGRGLNLQTHTPVISVKESNSQPGQWEVNTPRGSITAGQVIVASNAYTSGFLPDFKDLIFPVRGTACSITPAQSHSYGASPGPIKYTYGFRHGPGEVDYMIPRQGRGRIPGVGDKSYILGGAKGCFLNDLSQWYDNKQDDQYMPGAKEYFGGFMKKHFADWNGNEKGNVDKVWSGILGYSADLLPYVGEIPDKPGVFVCAGFTGHGMPRIPGCSAAISSLVASRINDGFITANAQKAFQDALPQPYWLTRERYTSKVNLIKAAMGQGDKTKGALENSDEAVLAGRAVRAKL